MKDASANILLFTGEEKKTAGSRGEIYASVDLGTNSCRLLITRRSGKELRVIESFSRIVRLGEDVSKRGVLAQEAKERTISALSACARKLSGYSVKRFRGVATQASRQALDGAEFLQKVHECTSVPIEIISPREEIDLVLEGCLNFCDSRHPGTILFDIGGGSTEIAWVRYDKITAVPYVSGYFSLPVGVVSLSECLGSAIADKKCFDFVVDELVDRLREFDEIHNISREIRQGGVRLIGTSGTMTTLASVILKLPYYRRDWVDGAMLHGATADEALVYLRSLDMSKAGAHPCIGARRAEFVLPGCVIFAAIRKLWPTLHVIVADRGLREGIILKMARENNRSAAREIRLTWPKISARTKKTSSKSDKILTEKDFERVNAL